jgi:hypothetical protein
MRLPYPQQLPRKIRINADRLAMAKNLRDSADFDLASLRCVDGTSRIRFE